FLFMNLTETPMPFRPPARFIDQIAPWLRESKAARSVMRRWNRDAYRWAAPLSKPLTDTESRVLNALYDAEVAYQDDYMGELLDILAARPNTLTIIVGDHGDAIGDHGFMGHTFAAYQELVHVPLIVHWPEQISAASASECVASGEVVVPFAVSTRRVYHTMLAAAGFSQPLPGQPAPTELSLPRSIEGDDPEDGTAYAEVYAPLNFAEAVARREPELLERLRCLATRRAVVNKGWKLIQVDGVADELFDLAVDPEEKRDKLVEMKDSAETDHLNTSLATFTQQMHEHRASIQAGDEIDTDSDEMQRQMRALGYIE
ncbi:MAG: sulfatase-like hydrolase/transferase, partial [Methylococcales bacterium]|nr:sulfatase-like hydrolase/transferase [Methylococcales bacterium]